MITIHIGTDERPLQEASPNWINEKIGIRRRNNELFCLIVDIQHYDFYLTLGSANCARSRGGGGEKPAPKPMEIQLLSLWEQYRLNGSTFTSGDLIAFLQRVKKLLNL